MAVKKEFNRNYNAWFINDVMRAIRNYGMVKDDDRVCVALSGGKDSATLLYALWFINHFNYLKLDIAAAHIRMQNYDTGVLKAYCDELEVPYWEQTLQYEQPAQERVCYLCSRLKLGALASLLSSHGVMIVGYGHHADDAAETLFMNLMENKKIGSFSPKVTVTSSSMVIIRPLIYLEEQVIRAVHGHAQLPLLSYQCAYAATNRRAAYKEHIMNLSAMFGVKHFPRAIVHALENVDRTNIWAKIARVPDNTYSD